MSRFGHWVAREFVDILPIWIFFFFTLGLLSLTRTVILARYGIQTEGFTEFFVGSLIVAKVFLVADKLPLTRRLDRLPLIYVSLWKAAIFTVLCVFVKYLEGLVHLLRRHYPLTAASREVFGQMTTAQFFVVDLWLVCLLFAFCASREVIGAWGKDRFFEKFLGIRAKPGKPNRRIAA